MVRRGSTIAAQPGTRKSLGPEKQKRTLDLFLQRRAARVLSQGSMVTGVVAQTGEEFRSKVVIEPG